VDGEAHASVSLTGWPVDNGLLHIFSFSVEQLGTGNQVMIENKKYGGGVGRINTVRYSSRFCELGETTVKLTINLLYKQN